MPHYPSENVCSCALDLMQTRHYIEKRKEEGMEERECVDQWDVDEEEWAWEELWREREWDEAWETCNITWHNDMIVTAEEYDRLQLTE